MNTDYKDKLELMRGMGEWTPSEKMMWEYFSTVIDLLAEISDKLPADPLKDPLLAQWSPTSQGGNRGGGIPRSIKSEGGSRLSP